MSTIATPPNASPSAPAILSQGSPFPNFQLAANADKTLSLSDYRGKWLVVYFYPKDMTSGCTVEAKQFRDLAHEFQALDCQILGVSADSVASHNKFVAAEGLNFPLLSDSEKALAHACGVWVEKSMYGRKYMGLDRASFLIDGQGVVRGCWRKVKANGHAAEVLATLRQMRPS